jgi:hypothetical protein
MIPKDTTVNYFDKLMSSSLNDLANTLKIHIFWHFICGILSADNYLQKHIR